MSLTAFVLGLFLILFAISALGWVAVSSIALGICALVAGILVLVNGYHPITLFHRG